MARFDGRVALVTGGGSGIGRATALAFADEGAAVVVADVDGTAGRETVADVESRGGRATFVRSDVTDPAAVEGMVETALDAYGRLDYGFNNAGVAGPEVPTADHDEGAWTDVVDVNLNGVWRCLSREIEAFLAQDEGGAVVNTASVLGKAGAENYAAYAAAKHGVVGLTRTAALEYADAGIRVNAVCPGYVSTPMLDEELRADPDRRQSVEKLHALGRLGRPSEVADAVTWLCSDAASFVTGAALDVDGGYLSR